MAEAVTIDRRASIFELVQARTDIFLAVAIVAILMFLIIPLPSMLLDILLAVNISCSLMILLVPMYIEKPSEFSVFPGVLLIVTLFRLSLNVASTRLILGEAFAGNVIEAFGSFVVKGNYVVGLVIFIILIVINFTVITKGSGRVAEVAARFTLDAMPGKQMAIDADLNAGLIDEQEAKLRRLEIRKDADFYGSMDGASKFVRGDAMAGVLITAINIVGGLIIGVAQMGMPFIDALETYTVLTVGDGLVSQIPALLISTSAGIIVTRAASEDTLARSLTNQLLTQPRASYVSGGVLFILGLVPGLPFIPFFLLGIVTAGVGYIAEGAVEHRKKSAAMLAEAVEEEAPVPEDKIEGYLHVDPLEIEIGYSLIPMIDRNQGGDLLDSITMIRKQIAGELGIVVPPIRIRDNVQLNSSVYVIKIKGNEIARGEVMTGYFLALTPDGEDETLEGIKTMDPTYGLPAYWLNGEQKERAEVKGYAVVDASAVISTHLMEILKRNSNKLLDRQATQTLLDNLKEDHAAVVDELVPNLLSIGAVQNVLRNLLKENIPIRDLVTILETLADRGNLIRDPEILTEHVRIALAETITTLNKNEQGEIVAMTLDARFEEYIMGQMTEGRHPGPNLGLSPRQMNHVYEQVTQKMQELLSTGDKPIMVTGPSIRRFVKRFFEPAIPQLSILSISELLPHITINTIGSIGLQSYD